MMREDIKAYGQKGLQALMAELGQPRYRALQLAQWLYGGGGGGGYFEKKTVTAPPQNSDSE